MIYLDYAATSPIDANILDAYHELLGKYFANSSSIHTMGNQTAELQTRAREQIARAFNVEKNEIVFTSGATESNNLAIKGVAFHYASHGKHIITTKSEHPSVLNVCKQLSESFGYEITYLDLNTDGVISVDDVKNAIKSNTILVSTMFVNNETGAINPIDEIGELLAKYPHIYYHVDMTQAVGKLNINLKNIDLASMSAHKINGLKGSGLLIKKGDVQLMPLICGGSQENSLRAGTSNWPANVILAKTIRIAFENQKTNFDYVNKIYKYTREMLSKFDNIIINSPVNSSPYILNFSVTNKKSAVVTQALESDGICVSTVSACSSRKEPMSYVIKEMFHDENRAKSSIRLSFSKTTTFDEIDSLQRSLTKILSSLKSEGDYIK